MPTWLTLGCLLGTGAVAMYWLAAADARDLARRLAFELCGQSGVQLLDQSVVLRAVRLVRRSGGFGLRWRYQFEYSGDGVSRRRGELTLVGGVLESAVLALQRDDRGSVT